jgi:hypothetical protein
MIMEHEAIVTQEQYDEVASRIEELKDVAPGSEEAKELKLLTKLIVQFESKRFQPTQTGYKAPKHGKS